MLSRVAHFAFSNFVIGMFREIALSPRENSGVNICADGMLSDLEYADDVVLPTISLSVLILHVLGKVGRKDVVIML